MDDHTRIPAPNYTQIPNAIFDLMSDEKAHVTEAELRVILAIARKTFGWHKKRDKISLTQLEKLTALSRPSVKAGIDAAIARGIVRRTPDKDDGRGGFFYELMVEELNEQTGKDSLLVKEVNQLNSFTRTSKESLPELVKNFTPQKKEKEKKESESGTHAPALDIYSQLTGIRPAQYAAAMIAEQVTDTNRWERTIKDWLASGFKPANVKGMLDWYHGKGRHQNNGASNRTPADLPMRTAADNVKPVVSPEERRRIIDAKRAELGGK